MWLPWWSRVDGLELDAGVERSEVLDLAEDLVLLEADDEEDDDDLRVERDLCGVGEVAREEFAMLSKKMTRDEIELFNFEVFVVLSGVEVDSSCCFLVGGVILCLKLLVGGEACLASRSEVR